MNIIGNNKTNNDNNNKIIIAKIMLIIIIILLQSDQYTLWTNTWTALEIESFPANNKIYYYYLILYQS